MVKVSVQREQSQPLILPARRLNAALRKSAERALRRAKSAASKSLKSVKFAH